MYTSIGMERLAKGAGGFVSILGGREEGREGKGGERCRTQGSTAHGDAQRGEDDEVEDEQEMEMEMEMEMEIDVVVGGEVWSKILICSRHGHQVRGAIKYTVMEPG